MNRRFFLAAHPLQALAEAWLLGLLVAYCLAQLAGYVVPFVMNTGLLLLCGASGAWAVVRVRLPRGSAEAQLLLETSVGTGLSLVMLALHFPAGWLGLASAWAGTVFGPATATLLFILTGPGYLIARGALRTWLFWDRLRRRRMLWALTHAHLMLVVLMGAIGAVIIFLISPYSRSTALLQDGVHNPMVSFATRVVLTIFPTLSVMTLFTLAGIAVLLPPSALFSFLVARRTTRRLEKLAAAAKDMRDQNWNARVPVEGEDEVAQVQMAFNDMAGRLAETLRDLQAQRDQVAHLLDERRALIANVSHELRTPVATVRATLESTLGRAGDGVPAALCHDLDVMDGEMARLQGLIDDLFALARSEAGGMALDLAPTDVCATVQHMVDAVAPLAWRAGKVQVTAEVPPSLPRALTDAARLEQALANLLRNAVRHTPPGGIVVVGARQHVDGILIEVCDTGEGIPAEELPHVWERFYRGATGRAHDAAGAGLGLALVKELIEAMGGRVAADSTPGGGSRFSILLPR